MRHLQTSTLRLAIIVVIASSCDFLHSQDSSASTQPASIAVSITMKQNPISLGQKPWVILTEKNISNNTTYGDSSFPFRLHVEGEKGQPPMTYYHRQVRGEPGVPGLAGGGIEGLIGMAPGKSNVKEFDLTVYYDLKISGKYTVYLEVRDESGTWLRTNTVQFEITKPVQ
jgi:hypothetical protein